MKGIKYLTGIVALASLISSTPIACSKSEYRHKLDNYKTNYLDDVTDESTSALWCKQVELHRLANMMVEYRESGCWNQQLEKSDNCLKQKAAIFDQREYLKRVCGI